MYRYIIDEYDYITNKKNEIEDLDNICEALDSYKDWCYLSANHKCDIRLYRIDENGKETMIRLASFTTWED